MKHVSMKIKCPIYDITFAIRNDYKLDISIQYEGTFC